MLTLRIKLLTGLDRILAIILAGLLLGTSLAFGGGVWWARLAITALSFTIVLAWLGRSALAGPWRLLKSPLTPLGAVAVALGAVQLVPIPASLLEKVSPRSVTAYSLAMIPEKGLEDDPSVTLPEPFLARAPISLDRAATLRWLVSALACLGVFVVSAHFSDRFRKSQVIWGSVVAAFFVNAVLGAVQVTSLSSGLYGMFQPGSSPIWGPTLDDAMNAPSVTTLRPLVEPSPNRPMVVGSKLQRQFLFGSLMGGPGAFLALGSLALPLAFGLMLHTMAPRGLREGLMTRLNHSGQGSLVFLMLGLIVASSVLVGVLGGLVPSLIFGFAMAVVGVPGTWSSGLRKTGIALTLLVLGGLAGGVAIGDATTRDAEGRPRLPRIDWEAAKATWSESLPIVKDFPILGTGFGSFPTVHPYYKSRDGSSNTAMSTLLEWTVESGAVGLGLLAMAWFWCLIRLPGAIGRVGTADRALPFGLLGSLVGFGLFSAIHWTVDLTAVALAASGVAGTANRWLAGGTDLFVDRA